MYVGGMYGVCMCMYVYDGEWGGCVCVEKWMFAYSCDMNSDLITLLYE